MKNSIQTHSGIWIDPSDANVKEINIDDICHSLSNTGRFNGHCSVFYSVAQHSVIVSHILEKASFSKTVLLAGLLHDAHEAYLGDMPSPLKKIFTDFAQISDELQLIINKVFEIKISEEDAWEVKKADYKAFHAEVRDLVPNKAGWTWPENFDEWQETILPLNPLESKALFMKRFLELKN